MKWSNVRKDSMGFDFGVNNFIKKREFSSSIAENIFLQIFTNMYDLVTYREESDNEISKAV